MTQTPKRKPQPIPGAYPFLTCPDLETLERPRYFTGQLLTAEELNSEQAYSAARQRLYHRYLHGPRGRIVAGLQVAKSDKPGFLSIAAGYAIDYCGNDIVVPTTAAFNVVEQIRANADALGSTRSVVWNPAKTTEGESTPSNQQQYWLTIAYAEQEARPANALRQNVATSTDKRKDCGCGSAQSGTSSTARANSISTMGQPDMSLTLCEPTRIREVYCFDVVTASDATTALSDARLTGDNRLVLARITVQNGDIVQIENDVAARQAEPPPPPPVTSPALSDLQNTVTALQDALRAVQDEIALLKTPAPPPTTPPEAEPPETPPEAKPPATPPEAEPPAPSPVAKPPETSKPGPSTEVVEPPPGEENKSQSAELEAKPPDNAAPGA